MEKKDLRSILRHQRRAITLAERAAAAQAATKQWIKHALFLNSQHIACYMATQEEFDCTPIIEAIWAAGKNCYLPMISGERLQMVAYSSEDTLIRNAYGILEPDMTKNKIPLAIDQLDIVLMPLVGFDDRGHRIGMGAGYYDRTLAGYQKGSIFLLGLGYACQQVSNIFHDPWDVNLHGVLTENGLFIVDPLNLK